MVVVVALIVVSARSTVSAVHAEWGTTTTAFTVVAQLGPGDAFDGHIESVSLPSVLLASDALTERPDVAERAVRTLAPGDIITERDLLSAKRSSSLGEGQRALSLPMGPAMPLLYVGDRIELVVINDVVSGLPAPVDPFPGTVISVNEDAITLSVDRNAVVLLVAAIADGRVVLVRR